MVSGLRWAWVAVLLWGVSGSGFAADLSRSRIVISPAASAVERQAAVMLREEVEKRTGVDWPVDSRGDSEGSRIVLVDRNQVKGLAGAGSVRLPGRMAAEGFAVRSAEGGRTLYVVGADNRGVLFGAGYLLRHLGMARGTVGSGDVGDVESAPAYPVRGHQLGYRPKNNTFDAWTPAQFEQYIRDLAIFGTNTIELIPPRSDDDASSPLFPVAPMPMMVKLSEIIARYGLDCSIWYPALDKDYSDPATVEAAVAEWGAVFDQLPRIDAVFVPGGDPGHTEPKYLMALLEKETGRLHQKHPKAEMWVSPQGFSREWMEEFYGILAGKPKWLTGVVYGPEMRESPEEFRRRVPAEYAVRFYPDTTHVLDAQYPVPHLDPAFAVTEGREPVNPRPVDEGVLFHRYMPVMGRFVAYSEGSNDDVNMALWSGWGWDPKQTAETILREYARVFLDAKQSTELVRAIEGLEQNWRGPVVANDGVRVTLKVLQEVDRQRPELAKTNWRFQQLLYRGYYDAYVQERARREGDAEKVAVAVLKAREPTDATLADAAKALADPVECSRDVLCRRVQGLADDLFHSVGMQLSVGKYQALAVGRGANLDRVNAPVSDAPWLRAQIAAARSEADPMRRKAVVAHALEVLGADGAGQYDVLADSARSPHLVRGKSFEEDPSGLERTYDGVFEASSAAADELPLVHRTYAGTLYDRPLEMEYRDLAPNRPYRVEVHFTSDARRSTVSANGTKVLPVCRDEVKCLDAEYAINSASGALRLTIAAEAGRGGNGRFVTVSTVRVSARK